jgi:hypothetical protein
MKPGADLERGAEQKLGAHLVEVVLVESAFEASQANGKASEFFLGRRDVFLLQLLELERFEHVEGAANQRLGLPIEEGGFGNVELLGDPAEAPAVAAQSQKGIFWFGRVHRF